MNASVMSAIKYSTKLATIPMTRMSNVIPSPILNASLMSVTGKIISSILIIDEMNICDKIFSGFYCSHMGVS